MRKIDIKNLSKNELEDCLEGMGEPRYRAKQIFGWLYRTGVRSFDEMTDLPADLRKALGSRFHLMRFVLMDSRRSHLDGTTKYLFKLEDGNTIESVFLPEGSRAAICLSSQVGCKMRCGFCASSPFGFVRDLTASEMIEQVLEVRSRNQSKPITHLVFMGIGEGLDNYDNTMKAVRILNDKDAFNIGARRITISTCGIIPAMKRLEGEGLQIELSVSLHSTRDEVRSRLVPVNKRYPIKDLITACREYIRNTNRVITFEYILIKGINSSAEDARDLARLLKGMKCKVNTIAYNQVSPVRNCISNGVRAIGYDAPSKSEAAVFLRTLRSNGINAVQRKPKGADIDAGCGQLRIARL